MRGLILAGMACTLLPGMAMADATIGTLAQQLNSSGGHTLLGQSFTVPTGETGVISGSFLLQNPAATDTTGTWGLYVYTPDFDTNTAVFGTLLGSGPITLSASTGPTVYTHTFNTPVTENATYAVVVDFDAASPSAGGFFSSNSYYAGGNTIFQSDASPPHLFPTYDMSFEVNFGTVPEPGSIGLAGALVMLLGRRRRAA